MSRPSSRRACAERALVAATVALCSLLASPAPLHAEPLAPQSRADAPSLVLPALDGGDVRLDALEGKVVVLAFWATWCAPCLQELPHLDALYRELGGANGDLVVLAISTDGPETRAEVATLVRERGFAMPVLLDEAGEATSLLNPRGANPFTVVLDRHGRIAATHEGYAAGDELILREELVALLAEAAPGQQSEAQQAGSGDSVATPTAGVGATHTLLFELHRDNGNGVDDDDHYGAVVDRFNAAATAGRLTLAMRTDAVVVLSEPDAARYRDDWRLERLTVRYQDAHWSATVGDLYRQLGRGIVLSLRKLDEAAVDLSLRGAQVEHRGESHAVSLFGGVTNPVNLDDVSRRFVADVRDALVGVAATWRPTAPLQLGAHAVYLTPEEELLGERRHVVAGGLSVELSSAALDWLGLYLELDAQVREALGLVEDGLAGYLAADLWLGEVALLLEGLWLRGFEMKGSRNSALGQAFDLNQPPTLERIDQEIANQRDVAGGRVRAELGWLDGALATWVSLAVRVEDPEEDSRVLGVHGWAGVRWHYLDDGSRLELGGGYRHESQLSELVKSTLHAELDLVQHLVDGLSLHVQVLHETRAQQAPGGAAGATDTSQRGSALVGLDLAGVGSLSGELGYDTLDEGARNLFGAGVLAWQAQSWFDLQLVVGTRRGGLRCIAGVCRNYPPFAGAQLRIVNRF